jgi:molybdenum cofactor cytidylyltransferase
VKLARALRLTSGDVLALTGGGGKTATMFRLAAELSNGALGKWRVLTTTSTRIFAVQIKRSPAHVTFDPARQTIASILPSLEQAIDRHGQVLLIGQAEPKSGKAFGIPPDTIDALAATGRFDLIINEADGSRMRPFKAPAAHEPVIPDCTTVVTPMVGLDVLGQLLDDKTVHRAELVSRLSGTALGHPVTADTVARVFCHPQGALKNVPSAARVIPLLNKVDMIDRLLAGRDLAEKLLVCDRFEAVAIGAVEATDDPIIELQGRTAAIILAAGGSARFGSAKQLARWQGQSFIERAVDVALASPARPVIVVLGAEVEQSQAALGNRPVEIVINQAWAGGQSSSMRAGLAYLPAHISSAIFMLVDQPWLQPQTIAALIERYRQTLAPVVWPEFEGYRGNPILFDRALFSELQQISGDTGGRPLLQAYQNQAERVPVPDQGILIDVDRMEDLEKLSSF